MRLAVMQPYFFPYIGYFQMVGNCDLFISYDSVDYIQRGWINRNRILISNEVKYITVPVCKNKLGTPISKIEISNYSAWKEKFLNTIKFSYKKSPYFNSTYTLLEAFLYKKEYKFISDLAIESILEVFNYLDMEIKYIPSKELNSGNSLNKYSRLDYYIEYFNADQIILPPGSINLYKDWSPKKCEVKIMKHPKIKYSQPQSEFIENLSIIDILMNNNIEDIKKMIDSISYV